MNWIKKLWGFTGAIPRCSSPCYTVANNQQNGFVHGERIPMFKQAVLDNQHLALGETLDLARCLTWNPHQIYGSRTNFCQSKHYSLAISHQFKHGIHTGPNLSRDFLVKLWVADWEMKKVIEKRERKIVKHAKSDETVFSIKGLSERFFSGSSVTEERPCESKDYHRACKGSIFRGGILGILSYYPCHTCYPVFKKKRATHDIRMASIIYDGCKK